LVREKEFVGLLWLALSGPLLSLPLSTDAVALSQSIQNAHYVKTLTQNVSCASQPVAVNKKTDIPLNNLEATLLVMGDEVQTLQFRQELLCHAVFQHICATAAPYDKYQFPWGSIKAHVKGAWETNNDSLNLQLLRQ
jgi:hypothetical protein